MHLLLYCKSLSAVKYNFWHLKQQNYRWLYAIATTNSEQKLDFKIYL